MSDWMIKDGTGDGKRAKVDNENRLYTASVNATRYAESVLQGNGYVWPVTARPISVAATNYSLLLFNPTDPEKAIVGFRLYASWSGTEPVALRLYYGATDPTANHIPFDAVNSNTISTKKAQTEQWVWSGAGSGMTHSSMGTLALETYVSTERDIIIDGSLLWGNNARVAIAAYCPGGTGSITTIISGWEIDV